MTEKDLQKILRETGPYQAEYKPLPLSQKPVGCSIPALLAGEIELPPIEEPDIIKPCYPLFMEFPVVPEPFTIPETCPTGISFNTKDVRIFPSLGASDPAGTVSVGVSKNPDDLCTFDLELPDIVIPCFPTGPQIFSTASITIVDLNSDTSNVTPLTMTQDPDIACRWTLGGSTTITIPEIPCPNGIQVGSGNMTVTSTCARIIENKSFEIKRSATNPCSYDFNVPDLKIPCYPDGPKMSSNLVIQVRDNADSTIPPNDRIKRYPITLGAKPGLCCDFRLDGDVTIDVPCQDGITITETPLSIQQPRWYDSLGNDVTPEFPAAQIPIRGVEEIDPCHIGIEIPPIIIPCYPDGIQFKGAISFRTSDGVVLQDTINLSQDPGTGTRLRNRPCDWDITGIIDIPTPFCPEGFNFGYNPNIPFRIFARRGVEIGYWDPDEAGNDGGDGGNGGDGDGGDGDGGPPSGTLVPVYWPQRYHSIRLDQRPCGAALVGELNLSLPPFVLDCETLSVGANNTLAVYLNDPQRTTPYNIGLRPTGCGYEFTTPELHLPVLSCPQIYDAPSTFDVYLGNNKVTHTIKLSPVHDGKPGCGVALTGALYLPFGGGTPGFTYRPWNPNEEFGPGDSVSIVYPEGGRCIYNATQSNIPCTATPGTPSGEDYWENASCNDQKVFHPYKIIRCTESPEGVEVRDEDKKSLVKVVPRSYLFKNLKDKSMEFIYGLNTPFLLGPDEQVWIEAVFDNSGAYPAFQYAAICKGAAWDWEVVDESGTVPDVGGQLYKNIRKDQAIILAETQYSTDATSKIVGIDEATRTTLRDKLDTVLTKLGAVSDPSMRQLKAFCLIGTTSEAEETVGIDPYNPPGDEVGKIVEKGTKSLDGLVLQQGTKQYCVQQILDSHLYEASRGADNVPIILLEKVTGAKPIGTKLPIPTLTTQLWTVANTKLVKLKFETPDVEKFGNNYGMGEKSTDIQVYFTVDGSLPTVNTAENKKCFKWTPGNKIKIGLVEYESEEGFMLIKESDINWGITWMSIAANFTRSEVNSKDLLSIDPQAPPA